MRLSRRQFLQVGFTAAAAPAWLACDPFGSGGERLTARPVEPTIQPARGRTALGLGSGRGGFLYVPESVDLGQAAPLFVALHGAGQSSEEWSSYEARAELRRMILLVPESRDFTWDRIIDGFGPDVDFLDQALRHTFDRCRVDPARLCLAGFSDGASYALSLGVSNGALFSHLIAYSPGLFDPGDRQGKPRVFISHGIADGVLPVHASRDRIVPQLEKEGYEVTYLEFGGGHEVPADVSQAALDWFLPAG